MHGTLVQNGCPCLPNHMHACTKHTPNLTWPNVTADPVARVSPACRPLQRHSTHRPDQSPTCAPPPSPLPPSTAARAAQIFALGFVSVFEQVLESLPDAERAAIFSAYVKSLGEEPEQYKKDAAKIEQLASSLSGPDGLAPDANGTELQVRRNAWCGDPGVEVAGLCVWRGARRGGGEGAALGVVVWPQGWPRWK